MSNTDHDADESTEELSVDTPPTEVDLNTDPPADSDDPPFSLSEFIGTLPADEVAPALDYFLDTIKIELSEIKLKSLPTEDDLARAEEIVQFAAGIASIKSARETLAQMELVETEVFDSTLDDTDVTDTLENATPETLAIETDTSLSTTDTDPVEGAADSIEVPTSGLDKENKMGDNTKVSAPEILTPVAEEGLDGFNIISAGSDSGVVPTGDTFKNPGQLAQAILNTYDRLGGRRGWSLGSRVTDDRVPVANIAPSNASRFSITTNTDAHAVRDTFDKATEDLVAKRAADTTEALVASGGICSPFETNYNFFRLAVPQNPVEASLPSVQATRGGIRYLMPPDFRAAYAGTTVVSCADDAAGYASTPEDCGGPGPTPDKACICVECPTVQECCLSAVSACVRWGNFNYYTFPEQVESFMADLAVNQAIRKEQLYLDAIDAASIPVVSGQSYGAARDLLWDLTLAAVAYRYRNHMPLNATLDVYLPAWAVEVIRVDLANNVFHGPDFFNVTDAEIRRFFTSRNLNPVFYYDPASTAGQVVPNDVQNPGELNQFPRTLVSYLFAPGTFVRLDGWTMDLGIVRDSSLNATNDLQMFMEEFTGICKVGLESVRIEHVLCPDGTGGGQRIPTCTSNATGG